MGGSAEDGGGFCQGVFLLCSEVCAFVGGGSRGVTRGGGRGGRRWLLCGCVHGHGMHREAPGAAAPRDRGLVILEGRQYKYWAIAAEDRAGSVAQ